MIGAKSNEGICLDKYDNNNKGITNADHIIDAVGNFEIEAYRAETRAASKKKKECCSIYGKPEGT